jgi:hypothetical protein
VFAGKLVAQFIATPLAPFLRLEQEACRPTVMIARDCNTSMARLRRELNSTEMPDESRAVGQELMSAQAIS